MHKSICTRTSWSKYRTNRTATARRTNNGNVHSAAYQSLQVDSSRMKKPSTTLFWAASFFAMVAIVAQPCTPLLTIDDIEASEMIVGDVESGCEEGHGYTVIGAPLLDSLSTGFDDWQTAASTHEFPGANSTIWKQCYVAIVDSSEEDECIQSGGIDGYEYSSAYIGGRRQDDGSWQWLDGRTFLNTGEDEPFAEEVYSNWKDSYPTILGGGCVMKIDSGWINQPCSIILVPTFAVIECEPRASIGEPCPDSDECIIGIDCSGAGICGGVGAACTVNSQCLSGVCSEMECIEPLPAGSQCQWNVHCEQDPLPLECSDLICGGEGAFCDNNDDAYCADGYVCNDARGACLPLLGLGDECAESEDCSGEIHCPDPLDDGPRVCGGLQALCSSNNDTSCNPPLVCNGGHCQELGNLGDTCEEGKDCSVLLDCGDGVCGGEGAACSENDDSLCNGAVLQDGVETLVCNLYHNACVFTQPKGGYCAETADCSQSLTDVACGRDEICGGYGADCVVDDQCDNNYICHSYQRICANMSEIGEGCAKSSDCAGANCANNVCGGATAACEEHSQCSGDLLCNGVKQECSSPGVVGDACLTDEDCSGDIACSPNTLTCGGAGGYCNNDDAQCAFSLICHATECKPPGINGAACSEDSHCIFSCGSDLVCGSKDAECDSDDSCFTSQGFVCNAVLANTCQMPGEVGEPCSRDIDCRDAIHCSPLGICGDVNAECESNSNDLCLPPLVCNEAVFGTCQTLASQGLPCNEHSDCSDSFTCELGVCVTAPQPCTEDSDCAGSDIYCNDFYQTCLPRSDIGGNCMQHDDCAQLEGIVSISGLPILQCGSDLRCGGLDAQCTENEHCNRAHGVVCNSVLGNCTEPGRVGEPCAAFGDCDSTVDCSVDEEVCGGLDAACSGNDDLLCDSSKVCNEATRTCRNLGRPGEPCAETADCQQGACSVTESQCGGLSAPCLVDSQCRAGLVCNGDSCQKPQAVGGYCVESSDCLFDYDCAQNTCGGEEAVCTNNDDSQCFLLRCNEQTGRCSQLETVGGPCGEEADCDSLDCASGTCGGAGARCWNNNDADCDTAGGLVCYGTQNVCNVPGQVGDTCFEEKDCGTVFSDQLGCKQELCGGVGARCSGFGYCIYGCGSDDICGGDGAQCFGNDDSQCFGNLVCNAKTGTCRELQPIGGYCSEDNDCAASVGCGTNFRCGSEGARCSPSVPNQNQCEHFLICNSLLEECSHIGAADSPCAGNSDCDGELVCGENQCCIDTDGDGTCDPYDTDKDNDGVCNDAYDSYVLPPANCTGGPDLDPLNPYKCQDVDSDGCDDCSQANVNTVWSSGANYDPANDGPDYDKDGWCDLSDPDTDNDAVCNGQFSHLPTCKEGPDLDNFNQLVCQDLDRDGCDDCSNFEDQQGPSTMNDGPDRDSDGLCDTGDPDADDDGICNSDTDAHNCLAGPDSDALNPTLCMDSDSDSCDDCANGHFDPSNDGVDTDDDGICDAGDNCAGEDTAGDFDGDGVCDDVDPCPQDHPDDPDSDGACSIVDVCPLDNPDDPDSDGICTSEDSCPEDAQNDEDSDGVCHPGDICFGLDQSGDSDNDLICNNIDNCPQISNNDGNNAQLDSDGDGQGDPCDLCPFDARPQKDVDSDGVGDDCDNCDDPNEAQVDADGDGFGPPCDCDDGNSSIYNGAPLVPCNGIDENCNGNLDDDGGSVIATCVDTLDVSVGSSGSVSITPQMVALNSGTTCPRGYSLDKSEFSCADILVPNQVTLTVSKIDTDGHFSNNETCNAVVVVHDSTSPSIGSLQSPQLELDFSGNAAVSQLAQTVTVQDNCDSALTYTPQSFGCGDAGQVRRVELTATDTSGNKAVESVVVNVVDLIPPTSTLVADDDRVLRLQIRSNRQVVLSPSDVHANVSDNCPESLKYYINGNDRDVLFACQDVILPPRVLKVTMTDGFNPISENIQVEVQDTGDFCRCNTDVKPPSIEVPDTVVVDEFLDRTEVTQQLLGVVITDNCDENVSVVFSPHLLTCDDASTSPVSVKITAVDSAGLSATHRVDVELRFQDWDGDGFDTSSCNNEVDCDDTDASIHPHQEWYHDSDKDGYGNIETPFRHCDHPPPIDGSHWVAVSGDCQDYIPAINPDSEWFIDHDEDGFGTGQPIVQCERPPHRVLVGGDCNDQSARQSPGLVEVCGDGIDNNCDGVIDDGCEVGEPDEYNDDNASDESSSHENLTPKQADDINAIINDVSVLENTGNVNGAEGDSGRVPSAEAIEKLEEIVNGLHDLINGENELQDTQISSSLLNIVAGALNIVSSNANYLSQDVLQTLAATVNSLIDKIDGNSRLFTTAATEGSFNPIMSCIGKLLNSNIGTDGIASALTTVNSLADNAFRALLNGARLEVVNKDFSIIAEEFNGHSKKRMAESRQKRSFTDECDDVIGLKDLSRIIQSNKGSSLVVSRIDYGSTRPFDIISGDNRVQSNVQGANIRQLSNGEQINVGLYDGVEVSIPINVTQIRNFVQAGVDPTCAFFDFDLKEWSTNGVQFRRWGNYREPAGLAIDQWPKCIICRTHHFSDFGALLTGDRGGGQGGSDSDDGNAFGNAEFTTIFAVSWFLILLAIVLSVTVIVISYKVKPLRKRVLSTNPNMTAKKLRRLHSFTENGRDQEDDSMSAVMV